MPPAHTLAEYLLGRPLLCAELIVFAVLLGFLGSSVQQASTCSQRRWGGLPFVSWLAVAHVAEFSFVRVALETAIICVTLATVVSAAVACRPSAQWAPGLFDAGALVLIGALVLAVVALQAPSAVPPIGVTRP